MTMVSLVTITAMRKLHAGTSYVITRSRVMMDTSNGSSVIVRILEAFETGSNKRSSS